MIAIAASIIGIYFYLQKKRSPEKAEEFKVEITRKATQLHEKTKRVDLKAMFARKFSRNALLADVETANSLHAS